jgi:mutator family transposase
MQADCPLPSGVRSLGQSRDPEAALRRVRPVPRDHEVVANRLGAVHPRSPLSGIRKSIYTTNAIESLNARFRQATRQRGQSPGEPASLKGIDLVTHVPARTGP